MIVHMIGNAHIDPVWLWRWEFGVDEALATFTSAADRCEEYPQFVYTRGEAWLYKQVESIHPALFERVRGLVERGQWHVTGGQFVQPDTNLPTATSLRRQFTTGQRYFEDWFGARPQVGYNVDTFGHTATLPDILNDVGCRYYVFRRPQPHQVALPSNLFRWRGVNGGEVLAFRIEPGYVADFTDLYGQVMLAVEAADPAIGHAMCFYGVGNHGGGPSKAMIEWIIEHQAAFDGIELRFSTPQAYFDAVADQRDRLPTVDTELQHTFPGCYSVMHDVKSAQRHGELLLDQAAGTINRFADDGEAAAQHAKLDHAWEDLLFTAFHDVLPGTSIASAWPAVRAMQGRARIAAEEVIVETTRRWSYRALPRVNEHQIVVVNTDDAPLVGYVEAEPYLDFDDWSGRWVSDLAGNSVDFQEVQPESMQMIPRILLPADIPPGGHMQLLIKQPPGPPAAKPESDLVTGPDHLSNDRIAVRLGARGIADVSVDGRRLLSEDGISLHLREDSTDTWTFHTDRWSEPVAAPAAGLAWTIEEDGPLRARARAEFALGQSQLRWTVTIFRREPRLQLEIEVNFAERHRLLQLAVALADQPQNHVDGLAGGQIERDASPVEWPVHGWSRLNTNGVDLAVVTHDAYSLSLDRGGWQWTLLRSPKMAWGGGEPEVYTGRDTHTDQGVHHFRFELRSADGLADLAAAARQLVMMPVVFDRYEGMNRPPWGDIPAARKWGPAMQRNLADGRVTAPPDADFSGTLFRRADVEHTE